MLGTLRTSVDVVSAALVEKAYGYEWRSLSFPVRISFQRSRFFTGSRPAGCRRVGFIAFGSSDIQAIFAEPIDLEHSEA